MKSVFHLLACLLVLSGFVSCGNHSSEDECQEEDSLPIRYEYGLPIDSFQIDTAYIKRGETLSGILSKAGATAKQINGVTLLSAKQIDVRIFREGKRYMLLHQTDTMGGRQLCYMIYQPSILETYVLHLTDSMHVEYHEKPTRTESRSATTTIESSLWNAMTSQKLPVDLALELSEIYAWTIDFFGLQKGDSIRVYYDEIFVDSTSIGIGRIYAAQFYHGKRWLHAYYFDSKEIDGKDDKRIKGYFDEDGKSLKKAFLKAPLNYKRISSKFTYARKHPIFKTYRPHTGVDYAAPSGTPVVSIGDGKVVFRAYKGGGGNTVKIRHNSTYTSAYLHLSKFAKGITVGSHVSQGQVIGYVGSTGNSTGPHLDFRVWKNDSPIDPLKMVSPPVEPIPSSYNAAFDSLKTVYRAKL